MAKLRKQRTPYIDDDYDDEDLPRLEDLPGLDALPGLDDLPGEEELPEFEPELPPTAEGSYTPLPEDLGPLSPDSPRSVYYKRNEGKTGPKRFRHHRLLGEVLPALAGLAIAALSARTIIQMVKKGMR